MEKLDLRNVIGLALSIVSMGLLVPGLTLDMLTLKASFSVPLLGSQEVLNETNSVISTIGNLLEDGNIIVALLILLFSVIVPITKALLLVVVVIRRRRASAATIHGVIGLIAKWAMADVFVVGVLIAYLSLKTNENIQTELHIGFWFFLSYCIVSILGTQLIDVRPHQER